MYVVETRTCEGFAKLDKVPDTGLGVPMGVFEMRNDELVFTAALKQAPPTQPVATPAVPGEAEVPATEPVQN